MAGEAERAGRRAGGLQRAGAVPAARERGGGRRGRVPGDGGELPARRGRGDGGAGDSGVCEAVPRGEAGGVSAQGEEGEVG